MYYQKKPEIIEAIFYDGSERSIAEIKARYLLDFEGEVYKEDSGWLIVGVDECELNTYIIFDRYYLRFKTINEFEAIYSPTTLHLCDK